MHARAAAFIDRFAEQSLGRLFGDLPGRDRLVDYLRGRARRELGKLEPEKLDLFLRGLEALMVAVRTGDKFEEFVEMGEASEERGAA